MKKIYLKPTTATVHVETRQILAASDLLKLGGDNGIITQELEDAPTTDQTSGNLSRGFSVWDEWNF